jgi:hypothetical protein
MAEQTTMTRDEILLVELRTHCHRHTILRFARGKPVREATAARIREALDALRRERPTPAATTERA